MVAVTNGAGLAAFIANFVIHDVIVIVVIIRMFQGSGVSLRGSSGLGGTVLHQNLSLVCQQLSL